VTRMGKSRKTLRKRYRNERIVSYFVDDVAFVAVETVVVEAAVAVDVVAAIVVFAVVVGVVCWVWVRVSSCAGRDGRFWRNIFRKRGT